MSDDRTQQQPNQPTQESADPKKPYAQPQLTQLGSLETQTLVVGIGSKPTD